MEFQDFFGQINLEIDFRAYKQYQLHAFHIPQAQYNYSTTWTISFFATSVYHSTDNDRASEMQYVDFSSIAQYVIP